MCVWGFASRDRSPPIRHIWVQFTSQSQSPSSVASVGLNDLSSCCWRSSRATERPSEARRRGTARVSSRSRRVPPWCRSTSTRCRADSEHSGAQRSNGLIVIQHTQMKEAIHGVQKRRGEGRGGCVWMARRRSHQSEWMSRGWTCSPFRGWPKIKLICSITPEQLLGMSICRTLNWGWICHVTKNSVRIR